EFRRVLFRSDVCAAAGAASETLTRSVAKNDRNMALSGQLTLLYSFCPCWRRTFNDCSQLRLSPAVQPLATKLVSVPWYKDAPCSALEECSSCDSSTLQAVSPSATAAIRKVFLMTCPRRREAVMADRPAANRKPCPSPRPRHPCRAGRRGYGRCRRRCRRHRRAVPWSSTFPRRPAACLRPGGCDRTFPTRLRCRALPDHLHRTCTCPSCRVYRMCRWTETAGRRTDRRTSSSHSRCRRPCRAGPHLRRCDRSS